MQTIDTIKKNDDSNRLLKKMEFRSISFSSWSFLFRQTQNVYKLEKKIICDWHRHERCCVNEKVMVLKLFHVQEHLSITWILFKLFLKYLKLFSHLKINNSSTNHRNLHSYLSKFFKFRIWDIFGLSFLLPRIQPSHENFFSGPPFKIMCSQWY